MQASLDSEAKGKAEAIRQKKKLECDVTEIEIGLDHANRSNAELQKNCARLQSCIEETIIRAEEEGRAREEMREEVAAAERRMALVMAEMEEVRASCHNTEKVKHISLIGKFFKGY